MYNALPASIDGVHRRSRLHEYKERPSAARILHRNEKWKPTRITFQILLHSRQQAFPMYNALPARNGGISDGFGHSGANTTPNVLGDQSMLFA
jgi:hypothetical protein